MRATATEETKELSALLGTDPTKVGWARCAAWVGGIFALLLLVLIGESIIRARSADAGPSYATEAVTRGNLSVAVSATGNLAATNKVDVGSELSGTVEAVLVQENGRVKKGQVLARLDTSKLRDEITKAEASLASAQAKLAQGEATLKESAANLERFREVSRLSSGKVPSKTEMANAEATLARSQADVSSERASVSESRAELSSAQINFNKASIRSPIDGVVLTRSVEPGQTVAASLQVATLFTIAENLREMELKVYVDEADVGSVKDGQSATFTVDAYPGRKYRASVTRVAYGSTTKDNVVSYPTVLKVKNEDLSLRPGMTATAEIASSQQDHVLMVPNTALRFTPSSATAPQKKGGIVASLMPGPPQESTSKATSNSAKGSSQKVWTMSNHQLASIPVTVGVSDGRVTEITSGDLREGTDVITDSAAATK